MAGPPRAFLELHCHSSASFDSLAPPARLVAKARRIGLTHLAITDHERIDGALRARDLAGDDLRIIVGEEVKSADGDLIGLFPRAPGPARAVGGRDSGGHPRPGRHRRPAASVRWLPALWWFACRRWRGAPERAGVAHDYVEIHNARAMGSANPRAAAFANRHGLPGVAASDAHSVMELGVAQTVVEGPVDEATQLLGALGGCHAAHRPRVLSRPGLDPRCQGTAAAPWEWPYRAGMSGPTGAVEP